MLCQQSSKLDTHPLLSPRWTGFPSLSMAFMAKRSSKNLRASWGIGTGVLVTWATPGPVAGLWAR